MSGKTWKYVIEIGKYVLIMRNFRFIVSKIVSGLFLPKSDWIFGNFSILISENVEFFEDKMRVIINKGGKVEFT